MSFNDSGGCDSPQSYSFTMEKLVSSSPAAPVFTIYDDSCISIYDVSSESLSTEEPSTARRSTTSTITLSDDDDECQLTGLALYNKNLHIVSMAEFRTVRVLYNIFTVLIDPLTTEKRLKKYQNYEKHWELYREILKKVVINDVAPVLLPPTPFLPPTFRD